MGPSPVVGPDTIGMLVVRPWGCDLYSCCGSAGGRGQLLAWLAVWPSHMWLLSLLVSREAPLNSRLEGTFQNDICQCQSQHSRMRSKKMSSVGVSVPRGSLGCLSPLQKSLQDQPRCLSGYFLCIGTWSIWALSHVLKEESFYFLYSPSSPEDKPCWFSKPDVLGLHFSWYKTLGWGAQSEAQTFAP